MTDDPAATRRADFRVVFRGYDPAQVDRRLEELVTTVAELTEQRDRLAARLGELADRDLKAEFEKVGEEVASVLEAAREAAESMRDRASAEAARWRSEAMAEAESVLKAARVDAEALRADAWATGTQLLEQAQAEAQRIRAAAERESLSVRGEAEREAHYLTSGARREAEDLLRASRMEAERLVSQAKADHDEIIAAAHRQAEAAQERTRALEQRRQELMAELESVRASLASFEGELENKRQATTPPSEQAPATSFSEDNDWEEGHTVRIIRPARTSEPPAPSTDTTDAEALAAEVARLQGPETTPAVTQPEPLPPTEPEETATPDEAEPAPSNDLSALFQRLRQSQQTSPSPEEPAPESAPTESSPAPTPEGDLDPFEVRDRLLLPVTNQALRAVKRVLTEAQNEALDEIRVRAGSWEPSPERWRRALATDLEELAEAAAVAGAEAAREFGISVTVETRVEPPEDLSVDLAAALAAAVASAGGPREKAAVASRVFRGWRTDEAERRVRAIALRAYHSSFAQHLEADGRRWQWRPAGRLCPRCRDAAGQEGALPPAHPDCGCTVEPA